MSTAAARFTRRRTVEAANSALGVSLIVGKEFRIFQNMSFFGRLWWLASGRITISRKARRLLRENVQEAS